MEHLDQRKKITIMIAIMASMLFAALNQTIVSTALPRIAEELGGQDYISWIFTLYMLAATVSAILVGKLSDIYGRKPFIIVGLVVFIIGSFLCGTADSIIHLILYRGIQGLGGGVIMSSAFTAVGDLFTPRERGRWQGLLGGVFGIASVFGPTLGGYIVDHIDWHWVFWVFLPLGVVPLALIWILFPSVPRKEGERVDYLGSFLLTASVIPLLIAFSWAGTQYEWGSAPILALFATAVLSLIAFIMVEMRVKSPAVPLYLFKNSVFTVSNAVGFMMGAGMFGAIMYMPFFVQGVIGTSATVSGFVMMPMTLSMVIAGAVGGQLITKTGKYKKLALGGLLVMTIGMILLTRMGTETTNATAILYMIVIGLGLGVGFPVFSVTVQNAVDHKYLGVATASSQFFRQIGGTIGVSVMGTVMSYRFAEKLAELTGGGAGAAPVNPSPEMLQKAQAAALSYAMTGVFWVGVVVVSAAFLLTFWLKEIPLRTTMKKAAEDTTKEDGLQTT
jgi:EmrB/QacA subfamily drug resistance transporter